MNTSGAALCLLDRSDAVPLDAVSTDELGARIVGLAGRLASATCRWLLLIADFDAREGCAHYGLASTARWLSHHCGVAHRTALEHVRVARALVAFPALSSAMAAGRLSYTQVRAISRVPHGPAESGVVDDLIEVAEFGTTGHLETVVRGLRTVEDETADTDAEALAEYVHESWTSSSQAALLARLQPEHGAVVTAALDAIAGAENLTRPEALTRMAEIALAAVVDRVTAPRALRGDERAAFVIHLVMPAPELSAVPPSVPPSALAEQKSFDATLPPRGSVPTDELPRSAERGRVHDRVGGGVNGRVNGRVNGGFDGWIEGGPGLPPAVIERLLCAGRIRTALHDADGNLRDLGRSHRTVTARQFRALLQRDRHCTHPGCTSKKGIEAHHVVFWIDGGRTDLDNLVLLCENHHHRLHEGAFSIICLGHQHFRYRRSDGRELLAGRDPGRVVDGRASAAWSIDPWSRAACSAADLDQDAALRGMTSNAGPHQHGVGAAQLADDAPTTRWGGERLNRHWAVAVLAGRRYRRRSSDDRATAC